MHLGRFMHLSQKVVGVTLITDVCQTIFVGITHFDRCESYVMFQLLNFPRSITDSILSIPLFRVVSAMETDILILFG